MIFNHNRRKLMLFGHDIYLYAVLERCLLIRYSFVRRVRALSARSVRVILTRTLHFRRKTSGVLQYCINMQYVLVISLRFVIKAKMGFVEPESVQTMLRTAAISQSVPVT